MDALLHRLRRGSIPAPSADPAGPLTYAEALLGVYGPLNGPAGWPQMAAALDQAADGDGSALATTARAGGLRATLVPSQAINCADTPAGARPRAWPGVIARLGHVSRLRGQMLGWWLWAACTAWPVRPNAGRYAGPWNARTRTPILVIGTRFDPATSFANARHVARLLGNAVLLTHDGYGHTSDSDPSTCVQRATTTYLVHLVAPPRGTVCPSDRVPFDPDFSEPAPG